MAAEMQSRRKLLGLAGCLVAAAWVRWLLMTDWLSYDESVNYMIGMSPTWGDFLYTYSSRAHPPLSYLLTMPFLAFGSTALLARAAAFSCGLIGVALVFGLLSEALRRDEDGAEASPAALTLGTLLLGLVPIFALLSTRVRGYSLCMVFVWASFWLYLRMRASGYRRLVDHVALAALLFLAAFTEFAAALHLLALAAVLYAPLLLELARGGEWRRMGVIASPMLVAGFASLANYAWQMGGADLDYGHTQVAVYSGSLLDLPGIVAFLAERLPTQMGSVLPNPWGLAALALLSLSFTPLVGASALAGRARAFATYALVALSAAFLASLLGKFPFGGVPRHAVVIFPGILLAAFLTAAALVRRLPVAGRARAWGAAAAAAVFAPALAVGLLAAVPEEVDRATLHGTLDVAAFEAQPGPVVTNFGGRAYLSWWFMPGTEPRLMYQDVTTLPVFDYDGISVVRALSDPQLLRTALFYTQHFDTTWIFLAFRTPEEALETQAFLESSLARAPGVATAFSRTPDWLSDVLFLKLERRPVPAVAAR
jgi:hypothetical protein